MFFYNYIFVETIIVLTHLTQIERRKRNEYLGYTANFYRDLES